MERKSIWIKQGSLSEINALSRNTLVAHLGIRFTEKGEDYLAAVMEVGEKTHQPFGLLHGGASAALAETVGSMAGNLCVDAHKKCVGLEIHANHLRPVRSGTVTAVATPTALGRTIQVWDIAIRDQRDKLVCVSRLTLAVLPISAADHA